MVHHPSRIPSPHLAPFHSRAVRPSDPPSRPWPIERIPRPCPLRNRWRYRKGTWSPPKVSSSSTVTGVRWGTERQERKPAWASTGAQRERPSEGEQGRHRNSDGSGSRRRFLTKGSLSRSRNLAEALPGTLQTNNRGELLASLPAIINDLLHSSG